ncbi:hypothetical protein KP509_01G108400 [Ceratopteris richardii]|nr:hypothetical protein KP509_01G108400 [Ceratopteris richardii]
MLPYMRGIKIMKSSKKVDSQKKMMPDKYSEKSYPSLSPSLLPQVITTPDYLATRLYNSEGKCDALEVLVLDLQKVVQNEREKTLHLGNEVRVLQISENFLKERVQYLEEKSWDSRKDNSHSAAMEVLLQSALVPDAKKDGTDALIHELLKMVQAEKDRTTSVEREIKILQKHEDLLTEKIEKLEAQFSVICKQSNLCDGKY